MNVTLSNRILGATLVAFALTACTAGDDAGAPAASAQNAAADESANASSSGESNTPSPSPSNPASGSDAGPNAPNAPTAPSRTLPLQCQGPQAPAGNVICLETAEGRAGDIVDLEVHLIRTKACGPAEYATGAISVDPAKFELVNADYQQDCLMREQSESYSNPDLDMIAWQAFDSSTAPAGCTASAGLGKVDVIKVRIKPGTAPGDYDLPFETSELLGGGPDCSGVFLDVAGKIRVLP